jgi:hypothetical protein
MEINFSKYFYELPLEAQALYKNKLTLHLDNNEDVILPDPYACKNWVDDPTKWPDVQFGDIYNFLIYTTGSLQQHEH